MRLDAPRAPRALALAALLFVAAAPAVFLVAGADLLSPARPGEGFAARCWERPDFWRCAWLTVASATATTAIAALLGVPAAWFMARRPGRWRDAADALLGAVLVLPASSVGLCLVVAFQHGPLAALQARLGVTAMYSVVPGVLLAQGVLALAIGLAAWRAAFEALPPRYELVARALGAGPFAAFRRVAVPMARGGLAAGLVLAWLRAAAEFGAVLLFCGTFRRLPAGRFGPALTALGLDRADVLPVAMWAEVEAGNLAYGFAMAYALALLAVAGAWSIDRTGGGARGS